MDLYKTVRFYLSLSAICWLAFQLFTFQKANAQLVYTESFDNFASANQLPLGWIQNKVGVSNDLDNEWITRTSMFVPAGPPRTGAGLLAYRSWFTNAGESSFIASKRLDMRNGMPAGGATFNFWMFRSSGSSTYTDRIQVYVNDSAVFSSGPNGALLLAENITSATTINRSCSYVPAPTVCNGWNNYSYTIPNIAPFNGSSVYVIIVAISDFGEDIYIDDFSVNSYPLNQAYVANSAQVFSQVSIPVGIGKTNQQIIGCRMAMNGALVPRSLTNIEFNTFGSTNPTSDIVKANLWFTGSTSVFDSSRAILLGTYNSPWLTNYMFLTPPNANYSGMSNFAAMDHGDNFFWITYDINILANTGNVVDAEWTNFSLNNVIQPVPNPITLPGDRIIDIDYCVPVHYNFICFFGNLGDYINSVKLVGDNIPAPGINNNLNLVQASCMNHVMYQQIWYGNCPPPYPKYCPYSCMPPGYDLLPAVPGKTTTLTADGTTMYSVELQVGSYYSGNCIAAWIDFNRNGSFEPSEKIAQSGFLGAYGTYVANFTVPSNAFIGNTRLRVKEVWINSNIDPCANYTYGETEDYILNIVPECPVVPGWTTWVGINNDWNDPANWCPGKVPVVANTPYTNVRIPGGPMTAGYTYHRPVIRDSVQAYALKLRIENNDTIFIDSPRGGSLTTMDSLKIETATSALMVNSSRVDTAQVYNGLLSRPSDSPLSNAQRARSFLAFTQNDMLSKGIRTGDAITKIYLHIQRKSNGNSYKNLNLKYFYTLNAQAIFGIGAAANIPLPVGTPATPVIIFSGDVNASTFVPSLDGWGTIEFTLSTPIVWNGGSNPLIIEMCYDNTGFPLTGNNDEVRFTQTTSLRRYMNVETLSTYVNPGCSISPKDTVMSSAVGTAGTNTLTVPAANAVNILPGQLTSLGSQVVSVAGTTVTLSGNLFFNVNGNVIFYNTITTSLVYRPNMTFQVSRPYDKFPIYTAGHWENNGTFTAGYSRVEMNGSLSNQKISGSSPTTFYDLNINNSNHVLRVTNFTVTDSLRLLNGRLKLNNGLVTITNPLPSALSRTNGFIQSETDVISNNVFPFGRIRWNMGTTAGLRQIPFVNTAGNYIPMDYSIVSGAHDVIIGTYATFANNTNLPLPEVTNVYGYTGSGWNNSGDAIADRFYLIKDTLSSNPVADITFRYSNSERSIANPFGLAAMKAQRWLTGSGLWEYPFIGSQTYTMGNPDQTQVNNFGGFNQNSWWVLTGYATALPLSLLDFSAISHNDKVQLRWITEGEIYNSHFEVERITLTNEFKFIGRVESKGPSAGLLSYESWDYEPITGTQYYYLRQHDLNGQLKSYGPVQVKFGINLFEIVTTVVHQNGDGIQVAFNYNSNEPFTYSIIDLAGRELISNDNNIGSLGLNYISIDLKLAKGVYLVVLSNNEKKVFQKFFY